MDTTTSQSPSYQTQSRAKIEEAFNNFGKVLYPADARLFQSVELSDVWNAARAIENEQGSRRSLRNTRRIQPLLEALKIFGGTIETLCQGTPFLCYIWAPIKLMLVIFDNYTAAYEQLIDAYSQIAQHLPRFDRLSNAFSEQKEFQLILADIYSDIIKFHLQVYKIARRGGWRRFFDASWKSFSSQFNGILTNLARNRDLVDREAASFEILEAKENRRKLNEDIELREREIRESHSREVFTWLELAGRDREQEDLLHRYQTSRQESTCTWVLEHPKVQAWLEEQDPRMVLWLKGKPGSGKTTIAAYLAEEVLLSPKSLLLSCLCSESLRRSAPDVSSVLLRLLCAQILRSKPDLAAFVYENYVKISTTASLKKTRDLLKLLFESLGTTFLILDGLDEYERADQTSIIDELSRLLKVNQDNSLDDDLRPRLKLLICSRETQDILRCIRKRMKANLLVVSLTEEAKRVSRDIAIFTRANLLDLRDRFDGAEVDKVGNSIAEKADGMFLWVRLVLGMLEDRWSLAEFRTAVDQLPKGLEGVYESILRRLKNYPDETQRQNAQRILGLLCFALRPLKCREICDGLVFYHDNRVLNNDNKLGKGILDICKPLIEERSGNLVSLVHFTAQTYLQSNASGPYLVAQRVQSDIALSCIRYLETTKVFLPEFASREAASQIIKGFHDFFSYAHEFWVEHLSASIANDTNSVNLDQSQVLLSNLVLAFQKDHSAGVKSAINERCNTSELTEDQSTSKIYDACSDKISNHFPEAIQQYMLFRNGKLDPEQRLRKPLDIDQDPTNLTETYLRYRAILESLLDGSFPYEILQAQISTLEIEEFKSRNLEAAYLCRWLGCIRAWTGFSTAAERESHEASHSKQFRCKEPGCLVTFQSRQALRKHKRKYHVQEGDWILPRAAMTKADNDLGTEKNIVPAETLLPNYNKPWYRFPNIDVIRQRAVNLAAKTSTKELHGIVERMSQTLKDELKEEEIEPLAHHFRKIACKEFRAMEKESLKSNNHQKLIIKNTIYQNQQEIEAEADIDASIDIVVEMVLSRPAKDNEAAGSVNEDVSHLWINL